jgi:hypothetical protein
MSELARATWESGEVTSGGAVATQGTAGSIVSGASAIKGSYSYQIPAAANSGAKVSVSGNGSEFYVSFYIRFTAFPTTATQRLFSLFVGGSQSNQPNIAIGTAGQIRLRIASTNIGSSFTASLNTTYRIGFYYKDGAVTSGTTIARMWVASGDNAFGTVQAEITNSTLQIVADDIRLGNLTSSEIAAIVDNFVVDNTTLPAADPDTQTVSATGLNASGVGTPAVKNHDTIATTGISATGVGVPNLLPHQYISPVGLDLSGTGSISVATRSGISPTGYDATGIGVPLLSTRSSLSVGGVSSGGVGDISLLNRDAVSPVGVDAGGIGAPTISSNSSLTAAGVDAGAVGTPSLSTRSSLSPSGVDSSAIGAPTLHTSSSMAAPSALDDAGVGAPILTTSIPMSIASASDPTGAGGVLLAARSSISTIGPDASALGVASVFNHLVVLLGDAGDPPGIGSANLSTYSAVSPTSADDDSGPGDGVDLFLRDNSDLVRPQGIGTPAPTPGPRLTTRSTIATSGVDSSAYGSLSLATIAQVGVPSAQDASGASGAALVGHQTVLANAAADLSGVGVADLRYSFPIGIQVLGAQDVSGVGSVNLGETWLLALASAPDLSGVGIPNLLPSQLLQVGGVGILGGVGSARLFTVVPRANGAGKVGLGFVKGGKVVLQGGGKVSL